MQPSKARPFERFDWSEDPSGSVVDGPRRPDGLGLRECQLLASVYTWLDCGERLTGKGFLDVDHLPGAGLHETATVFSGILQAFPGTNDSVVFEIALVPRDDLDRGWHAHIEALCTGPQLLAQPIIVLKALFGFDLNHVHEVVQSA